MLDLCDTEDIAAYVKRQQTSYLAHIARQPNATVSKRLTFNDNKVTKRGRPTETLEAKVLKYNGMTADQFYIAALKHDIGHDHPSGLDRRKLFKK